MFIILGGGGEMAKDDVVYVEVRKAERRVVVC